MKKVLRVAVTGGAGQICYSLLFRIASGEIFGPDQPVAIHILEIPQALKALHGVELELHDCAFPLLQELKLGDDPVAMFDGVDYAMLVGARPRTKGMERADLLQENAKIFVAQGKAFTNPNVKVLVVGNPCNTNALVLLHSAKGKLKPENVRAMTRLDQNRAIAQLALKARVAVTDVKKVAIYGNHSPTMVVDYDNAEIKGNPVRQVISDVEWLRGEMMNRVGKRGAEIIIPFDELPPYHMKKADLKASLDRTHRWEIRSLQTHLKNPNGQAMYAVVHGGVDVELRSESCQFLSKHPFDGFAIGGSMGKTKRQMVTMLKKTIPQLPPDRPNHLLGIADLESLAKCVPLGIDTFDSSYPTKAARHGTLLTKKGPLKATKGSLSKCYEPIEEDCTCPTCRQYTLAYLNHLFKAHEIAGLTLATIHNLHFMVNLMKSFRDKILDNKL